MKIELKKGDVILLVALMILSVVLLIPAFNAKDTGSMVSIQVSGQEVLRLDLNTNQTVSVDGALGPVIIEVKDGKVAVVEENSPRHYCSIQGFVSNTKTPIICLPNETIVQIVSDQSSEEDVVIQ